jgi:hypothetical protein
VLNIRSSLIKLKHLNNNNLDEFNVFQKLMVEDGGCNNCCAIPY